MFLTLLYLVIALLYLVKITAYYFNAMHTEEASGPKVTF